MCGRTGGSASGGTERGVGLRGGHEWRHERAARLLLCGVDERGRSHGDTSGAGAAPCGRRLRCGSRAGAKVPLVHGSARFRFVKATQAGGEAAQGRHLGRVRVRVRARLRQGLRRGRGRGPGLGLGLGLGLGPDGKRRGVATVRSCGAAARRAATRSSRGLSKSRLATYTTVASARGPVVQVALSAQSPSVKVSLSASAAGSVARSATARSWRGGAISTPTPARTPISATACTTALPWPEPRSAKTSDAPSRKRCASVRKPSGVISP